MSAGGTPNERSALAGNAGAQPADGMPNNERSTPADGTLIKLGVRRCSASRRALLASASIEVS